MSERIHEGLVRLREMPTRGMITLRGDLDDASLRKAVEAGVPMPKRGRLTVAGARMAAWMSPDEVLLMAPHGAVAEDITALRAALAGTHHLVADVSDARCVIELTGVNIREVLAKLSPVDFRDFDVGRFRRTRLAQVPCAVGMVAPDRAELIAFRSVTDYVWAVLENANDAAAPVGHF
ncbi:MAG: sarcosine oxidase subunit gamma family protein [Pseudomonadota bacterium]